MELQDGIDASIVLCWLIQYQTSLVWGKNVAVYNWQEQILREIRRILTTKR